MKVRDASPGPAGVHRGSPRSELYRKLIHLGTATAPLAVWFLPRHYSLALLGAAAATALAVEFARREIRWLRYHFLASTRHLLRHHERRGLAGATYMALGYLIAAIAFPRPIAVAAMLYDGLADAAAALVGRRWGRHRVQWGKSWEGAAAALLVSLLIGIALPGIGFIPALLGAFAAASLEFLPLPLDDNLRITIGGGFALWLATLI